MWRLSNRYPVPAPRWWLLVDPDGNTVEGLSPFRLRQCIDISGLGCLVSVYSGIRRGVLAVTSPTSWAMITPEGDAASWHVDEDHSSEDLSFELVRVDIDGSESRATWHPDTGLVHHPGPSAATPWNASLVSWEAPGGELEGMLSTPEGDGPWPLVVYLHGGPWFGLSAGDQGDSAFWTQRSSALFQPDYSGSGILGEEAMWEPLRGVGMPDRDLDADGILAGVAKLVADGIADPDRLYVYGHSAGAYLTNRIITRRHPFAAAASWEGTADPRRVGDQLDIQIYWRGCTPEEDPGLWGAAAPVTHAARVTVPVTIIAGLAPHLPDILERQRTWYRALDAAGVVVDLHEYDGEGHTFTPSAHRDVLGVLAGNWSLTAD